MLVTVVQGYYGSLRIRVKADDWHQYDIGLGLYDDSYHAFEVCN